MPRTLPRPNCRLDCRAVLVRLIPSLLSVKWFFSISHWHLVQVYASSVVSFLSPRTTSCGIQTLLCSSGVEKIKISQYFVFICPSPRFDSILGRLPDLSSLQSRVCPFCSRRWPGSVCVDHRHELLRIPRPIRALRPLVIPNSMQALGRCSPKSRIVVVVFHIQ